MFTPQAAPTELKAPPKRPASPMTGRPLRSKDLIPVDLILEDTGGSSASDVGGSGGGSTKFICPVSRKTITTQKVILIKNTRQVMLESVARDLAYPSMTCPVTSKPFKMSDVLELSQAASGFAASGSVEASKYKPVL
jgi:nitric oxide synthase-interacting protein